ncbi:hypothetical protein BjapCC829_49080 (plasmid) [Bradyrhizobium barranii]|uniref:Uncharacterized protein n=1 Tax=Bradyrhizobium barranii TaxID=2992140 RepID=A0ABY3R131_9BRAD|nr:hypothetical protein [Bradyrhizobium japonicum]UFW91954.1 hypothetical protein BjapCC829_49080 [Bradyrhizobium japonicum]
MVTTRGAIAAPTTRAYRSPIDLVSVGLISVGGDTQATDVDRVQNFHAHSLVSLAPGTTGVSHASVAATECGCALPPIAPGIGIDMSTLRSFASDPTAQKVARSAAHATASFG